LSITRPISPPALFDVRAKPQVAGSGCLREDPDKNRPSRQSSILAETRPTFKHETLSVSGEECSVIGGQNRPLSLQALAAAGMAGKSMWISGQ